MKQVKVGPSNIRKESLDDLPRSNSNTSNIPKPNKKDNNHIINVEAQISNNKDDNVNIVPTIVSENDMNINKDDQIQSKENNNNQTTELEKLLEKSLLKAYLYTSLPPFISQLAASLLLFLDGVVISSLLYNEGLSGLTFATTTQFLLQGFAQIISTGSISILSTLIGSNESIEYRDLIPSIIFWLNIIFSLFSFLILLFIKDLFILVGCEDKVLEYAVDYSVILIYTCPVFYFFWTYSMAILAEGLSKWNMIANILSSAFNAPISYLLIKYTNLGIKGAALGSAISCFISALLCVSLFFTKKTVSKIRPMLVFKRFKESINITKRIILIGLGDGLSYFAYAVTYSLFNYYFNETFTLEERIDGFASVGAFSRTYGLFMAFFLGFGSLGYLPIAGYYIGQKNKKKLVEITKYASIILTILLAILTAFCMGLHRYIGSLYSTNPIFLHYFKYCILIGIPTLFLGGLQYVLISYGQALGLNVRLITTSILCLVVYQPTLLVMFYYTTHNIFYLLASYPGNDILSIITLIIIFYKPLRKPDQYIINQVESIQENKTNLEVVIPNINMNHDDMNSKCSEIQVTS